jgi:DNA-binding transcriptional MerR regulator
MATHHPIRKHVPAAEPVIPDKLYFRIGDVAKLCEVPAYVLRFWETEFPQLKPNKGGTGQRLYRKKDVEVALRIKSLLYDQGFTIPGARQVFKAEARPMAAVPEPVAAVEALTPTLAAVPAPAKIGPSALANELASLRAQLAELQSLLAAPVASGQPASEPKVKTMRPRLVLEPKPTPAPKKVIQLEQRGLFGLFSDPEDSGPVAS